LGSKSLKKKPNNPNITTCCLVGFQEKSSLLIQKQSPAFSVVKHDWNLKWDEVLWSDEIKKRAFWLQTHQMGLVHTVIKRTLCPRLNILLDL